MGAYTFSYAKGLSYFSTDPDACVNCHIMQPQFDAWQKASHHAVAVCVDCHLPQTFFRKYLAKAENGWRHGEKFTTQDFHEPIYVQRAGLRILQENCVRCHQALVASIPGHGRPGAPTHPAYAGLGQSETLQCIHCHATAGHGERAGLGGPLLATELEHAMPAQPAASPTPTQGSQDSARAVETNQVTR